MEIPMTTAVVNGSSSSSRSSRVEKMLMSDGQSRVGRNGVVVVARDVACVFSACRRCNYSRGTSAVAASRMGGSRPGATRQSTRARTGETEAESDAGRRRISNDVGWCPPATAAGTAKPRRRRRQILHNVLTLLLLALAACRPCHAHDRELSDTDDEDGKFLFLTFIRKGIDVLGFSHLQQILNKTLLCPCISRVLF
jgi:hypothetical protein